MAKKPADALMSKPVGDVSEQTTDEFFEAASKLLHMDQSHDAIRSKIQSSISAEHRRNSADSGASAYYNTPYVHDVFGSETDGHVVHGKDGKLTRSKYKQDGKGGYTLSDHKTVKRAYVVANDNDADDKKESLVVVLDGEETEVTRVCQESECFGEILELQEAGVGGSAKAKLTLISAGKGSQGYYTEGALKKAAEDGLFCEGTQMFLNHQTKEERAARPEGDITKLVGVLTGKAEYVEGSNGNPGRLVAPAKVFGTHKDFIKEAKNDIGVSVRVGAIPSGKMKDGVPLVESMVYALSADFVTKAGRGGKIEEMYESWRGTRRPQVAGGTIPQENQMTEAELKQLQQLQESNTRQANLIDRLLEQTTNIQAHSLVQEAVGQSSLPPRAKARVVTSVMANLPLTDSKTLDVPKLQEAIKSAIKDEQSYLHESGLRPTSVVTRLGVAPVFDGSGKVKDDATVVQEAETVFQSSIAGILGKEKK